MKKQVKKSKSIMRKAPKAKAFVLNDGDSVMSLMELVDKLQHMEHHVFSHHVNEERNDFSSWVGDVFKQPRLAEEMQTVGDRRDMQVVLLKGMLRSK